MKKENLGKCLPSLKKLGFLKEFTAWDYYKQIYVEKTIKGKEANDFQGLLKQIIKNRVDGGYISIAGRGHEASQIGLAGKLVYDPALPATKSGYKLSSNKHKDIIVEAYSGGIPIKTNALIIVKQNKTRSIPNKTTRKKSLKPRFSHVV